jgi:putative transposase
MDQRVQFVATVGAGHVSFAEACRRFGISRKTGYKWMARYEESSVDGLKERSRAPHSSPQAIDRKVAASVLEVRRKHPQWGARKIIDHLENMGFSDLPAASTAHDLLKRHELVYSKPRRQLSRRSQGSPLADFDTPNRIWCADYKGQFQLGDRSWCYPLTVTDGFSRFLLLCHGQTSTNLFGAQRAFEKLFRERGLPEALRTDNGVPFGSVGAAGLTRLSAWWVKLGIRLERIVPGKPQQNGRHERMHRTLRETTDRPAHDLLRQQAALDAFCYEFNYERPHQGLNGATPASVYQPASRQFPEKLEPLSYPGHHRIRTVRHDGSINWNARALFLSEAVIGELVGLEEFDDDRWLVRFGPLDIAVIDDTGKEPELTKLPFQRTVLGAVQGKLASRAPAAPWTAPPLRAD